jgi:hypothetical protein
MIDAGESEEAIAAVIQHMAKSPAQESKPQDAPKQSAVFDAAWRYSKNLAQGLNPLPLLSRIADSASKPHPEIRVPIAETLRMLSPLTRLGNVGDAFRKDGLTGAANEVAAAIPLIGPAAEDISEQTKRGDWAGAAGKTTALIMGPKIIKGAGGMMKSAATGMARIPLPRTPTAVRTAALENRAMPGVISSGADRTATRIAQTGKDIEKAIATDPLAEVSRRNISYAPEAWNTIKKRGVAATEDAARVRQAEFRNNINLQPRPTVEGANRMVQGQGGSYAETLGKTDPISMLEREMAGNTMRDIGRAVPAAASDTSRMIDLQSVAQAHKTHGRTAALGTLPTIQARIAAAAAERLASPAAQGLYNVGRATQAVPLEAIRAAMLAELMKHSGRDDER